MQETAIGLLSSIPNLKKWKLQNDISLNAKMLNEKFLVTMGKSNLALGEAETLKEDQPQKYSKLIKLKKEID